MISTSNSDSMSSPKEPFEFNCDHLIKFCQQFPKSPPNEKSKSVLETKLKDLDSRWSKVDSLYEKVMLTHDTSITPKYKEEAIKKFDECVNAYYLCTSQILDLIKLIRLESPRVHAEDKTLQYAPPEAPENSNSYSNCIKLPPCDTEVFYVVTNSGLLFVICSRQCT